MPLYTFHCIERNGARPTFHFEICKNNKAARRIAERLFRDWTGCDEIKIARGAVTFTTRRGEAVADRRSA